MIRPDFQQPSIWREGITDLRDGARSWRLSYLLGAGEIRRRYARSKLGQFWVTLTTAMSITALGLVWSLLWNQPVSSLLPYVAVSMVMWTYISGAITDAPLVFVSSAPLLHNQGIPFATIIYGAMLKHLLILAHNFPIIIIVMAIFRIAPTWNIVLALIGMLLLTAFLFGVSYFLAVVCLRFRDLAQVVQNAVSLLFFISPVLWRPEQITGEHAYLLRLNPVAVYLSTIQKPMMGGAPTPLEWVLATGLAIASLVMVIPLSGWARRRLIYWL